MRQCGVEALRWRPAARSPSDQPATPPDGWPLVLLTDLDRLAITDEGLVLSGNFGKAKTDELLGKHGRSSYGDSARIYEPPAERRAR